MKHQTPTADRALTDTEALAHRVVNGDFTGLPRVDHPLYSDEEWQDAAHSAVDGDDSDFRLMQSREVDHDRFVDWQRADEPRREFVAFSDWLVTNGAWASLDAREARLRGRVAA